MAIRNLQQKKGSIYLYLALLIVAVALMVSIRGCSVKKIGPRPDGFAGGDTINVAIEVSPTGLSMHGDTLSGVYYDLIRQTFARHHRKVKFHPYTLLEDAVKWLQNGRCQMIVGDLPVTAEMRDSLIFVNPVGVDRQVLVQINDSLAIRNQFELAGKEVYVAKNSPFGQRLRNLAREIGDTIYVIEDSSYSAEQLVILTAVGEIPRAVVNRSAAETLAKRYPRLDLSVDISLSQFQSWALMPRDSLLRDSINVWLAE